MKINPVAKTNPCNTSGWMWILNNDILMPCFCTEFINPYISAGPTSGKYMVLPDGKSIPPTNKKLQVDFCTVAHWKNGKMVEENLFYDQVGMMKQLGLG
jgi:hypothetical protein